MNEPFFWWLNLFTVVLSEKPFGALGYKNPPLIQGIPASLGFSRFASKTAQSLREPSFSGAPLQWLYPLPGGGLDNRRCL
jgi:hypothetical protein